jgi:guanylate kinase
MTPEMLEQIKERMRQRGLTEEQIEQRLERMRQRQGGGS